MRFSIGKYTTPQPIALPRFERIERFTGSKDWIGYQVRFWNWIFAVITEEAKNG